MTKVLFLDIDGVVNSTRTQVAFGAYPHTLKEQHLFDQAALSLIRRLCESAGIQIVLSSAWRVDYSAREVAEAFDLPVIDSTPCLCGPRGEEILFWLQQHPEVEQYAILDDTPDMRDDQEARFIQTNPEDGLTWRDFSRLCGLFGESPFAGKARSRHWRTEKLGRDV